MTWSTGMEFRSVMVALLAVVCLTLTSSPSRAADKPSFLLAVMDAFIVLVTGK